MVLFVHCGDLINNNLEIFMKVIRNLLTFSLCSLSFLTIPAYAAPEQCPNIDAIRQAGVSFVRPMPNSSVMWNVMQVANSYGTPEKWEFSMIVRANNQDDAFRLANVGITALGAANGPRNIGEDTWMCEYVSTSGEYRGTAFTPSSPF